MERVGETEWRNNFSASKKRGLDPYMIIAQGKTLD